MKHKVAAMTLLLVAAVVMSTLATFSVAGPAMAEPPNDPDTPQMPWPINGDCPEEAPGTKPPCPKDNVILKWDDELLQAVRANPAATGPTVTARALGVLHTATYDAWAPYDPLAKVTRPDGPTKKVVSSDPTVNNANKSKAISYAAYRVLLDLFPGRKADFDAQMAELVFEPDDLGDFNPDNPSAVVTTPQGIGNKAAYAVLKFRHADGSNQTRDTKGTSITTDDTVSYPDPCTTNCYKPINTWDKIATTPNGTWHWQPLCVLTADGVKNGMPHLPPQGNNCDSPNYTIQKPLTPQWGNITPFALVSAWQFKVPGPPKNADGTYNNADISTAVADTSRLSDTAKVKAEYWADGPKSEFPPGHAAVFAQALSRKYRHSVDTDAKMFFTLGNAMLDSSIAAWALKYKYDFWRPVTGIRELYKNTTVNSWLGPYNGFSDVPGPQWRPYQAPTVVTPGFPEYVSGHSTFSAAGSQVLKLFTGSDAFGATVTITAGTSLFEPKNDDHPVGTPQSDVMLSWPTFSAAAQEAGMSRRYGGIHFKSGDEHGRMLGNSVGQTAHSKAQNYIRGYSGY